MSGSTWRTILALIVLAHGVGHVLYLIPSLGIAQLGQSTTSWLLTPALGETLTRVIGSVLWLAVVAGFVAAGVGLLGQQAWWRTAAVAASGVALLGLALFANGSDVQSQLCAGLMSAAILVALLMNQTPSTQRTEAYEIFPVGTVRRENGRTFLDILPEFAPALKELEDFSHVQVFWWFDKFADEVSRQTTQFDQMPFAAPPLGAFACRAPMRPNPIGLTTAKILHVDQENGRVEVADIDAFDGTPVLDLKAYMPSCDRVKTVHVPDWAAGWPKWLPEDGLGLEE